MTKFLSRRAAFATIELPLVIAFFGLIVGTFLTYRSGYVATGAWIGFGLGLPLVLLIAAHVVGGLRRR